MEQSYSSFRIIALRTLSGEDYYQTSLLTKKIQKALFSDCTYFFYNDYKDKYEKNGKWVGIEKSKKCKRVGESFFSINEDNATGNPLVSISAIVGKNGNGKSSIIEYIIRIINNFAIKSGYAETHDSLSYIEHVYGTLFYEIGNNLHYITCYGEDIETSQNLTFEDKKGLSQHLFFSIVSNYALYSYNSIDFAMESENPDYPWIDGVFHKNDSYQTPIVINPHRKAGIIDINKERELCRQRLMVIFSESESNRLINKDKIASGFAFNLETESKFSKKTLYECFREVGNINALVSPNNNFAEYKERRAKGEELQKWTNQFELDDQIKFWVRYRYLWNRYKTLIDLAVETDKQVKDYSLELSEYQYDLTAYIGLFPDMVEKFYPKSETTKQVLASLKSLSRICGRLNSLELQRLILIIELCELWEKALNFKSHLFSRAFKISSDRDHALVYLIYKTISIFQKYGPFTKIIDIETKAFMPFIGKVEQDGVIFDWFDTIEKCFKLLFQDEECTVLKDSYEFLKLRQTVNFITKNTFKKGNTDPYTERDFGFSYHVTFDHLCEQIEKAKQNTNESAISLLPPPIFVGEILIRDSKEKRFKFSDLSSGEQQMLNTLSGVIYHLRNLNYRPKDVNKVLYSFANVILEEVELYFHPEYQREYISTLLKMINASELNNIQAINIMVVTHSPFVLSDIPKNNVLFLKEGKPCRDMQEDTFGANIHSLMKNAFFLGIPMGGFAHDKIQNMFGRLHNMEYSDELFEEIGYVSEPLLKSQLIQMYSLNKLPHKDEDIELLMKRVKVLEDKLNGRD